VNNFIQQFQSAKLLLYRLIFSVFFECQIAVHICSVFTRIFPSFCLVTELLVLLFSWSIDTDLPIFIVLAIVVTKIDLFQSAAIFIFVIIIAKKH